jgi:DNA-binding NtrC family response regulator
MKHTEGKILIIDDNVDVLFSAKMLLKDHFGHVHTLNDPAGMPELLEAKNYDVVLLDMNYSGSDTSGREGLYWLRKIMSIDHPPQVVMITAFATIENAIQALKLGAGDFVMKPWENEKLVATVLSAYQLSKSRQEVRQLRVTQDHLQKDIDKQFGEFVGQSKAMKDLYGIISKVAHTDANVIILGENGTGKELVARSIHRLSLRSHKPMISVDLGSISESLFESELFGHVKGAFTDAREDRAGRFEIASGSTLFLDEIGNIPSTLQAKLLTALQNRTITRLGSNKQIQVDIRLICATNVSIYDKVTEGAFREDLLYRIKTIELQLPPLRQREGDIELLTQHFLEVYGRKYRKQVMKLGGDTLKKLERYSWPGNVRELQHAVERAVILSDHRILKPEDFYLQEPVRKQSSKDALTLDELEEATIKKALDKNGYNISRTAAELGLSRAALYRKIQKYDIK